MKNKVLWVIVSIVLISSSCSSDNHNQWLQFRGKGALGIAPDNANPPIHFNADTNIVWKTEIPSGWSSPCIVNDRIFLTGFNDSDSLLNIFAINSKNGTFLWKDSVQPSGYYSIHPMHSYASPTIVSDGNRIFASYPNYGLLAYDLDGNRIWNFKHEIITEFYYGGASSPVFKDSIVVLLINSKINPRIVALNCETGDSVWTIKAAEQQWASLTSCATPVFHDSLMIMHFQQSIVAYNLLKQDPEWWLYTPTTGVGTPVVMDDMLYLNTWIQGGEKKERGELLSFSEMLRQYDENKDGFIERDEINEDMYAYSRPEILDAPFSSMPLNSDIFFNYFDVNKNKAFEEGEWNDMVKFASTYFKDHGMMALPLEGSGERPVLDIKWKVNEDTPETPSPLVVNENVVFIKDGGILTVINRESGEVFHKERIGVSGSYLSSPILAGNKIIICSFNGTVTVISAENFSIVGQNKLNEKIAASPVAIRDKLYIRTAEHLYAFKNL